MLGRQSPHCQSHFLRTYCVLWAPRVTSWTAHSQVARSDSAAPFTHVAPWSSGGQRPESWGLNTTRSLSPGPMLCTPHPGRPPVPGPGIALPAAFLPAPTAPSLVQADVTTCHPRWEGLPGEAQHSPRVPRSNTCSGRSCPEHLCAPDDQTAPLGASPHPHEMFLISKQREPGGPGP